MKLTSIVVFIGIFFTITCNSFSQNLKTFTDSIKYQKQRIEFKETFIQANLEKNKKNYEQACALLYDCLKLNVKSSSTYYELAQIYYIQKRYFDAEINIKKAIKLNKHNGVYKLFLNELYIKMGKK